MSRRHTQISMDSRKRLATCAVRRQVSACGRASVPRRLEAHSVDRSVAIETSCSSWRESRPGSVSVEDQERASIVESVSVDERARSDSWGLCRTK